MSQIGKLYKYYLRKTLWRNWRVWGAVALCWVWWIVAPFLQNQAQKQNWENWAKSEKVTEENIEITKETLDKEFAIKEFYNKAYSGAFIPNDKAVKWWEDKAKETDDPQLKIFRTSAANYMRIAALKKNLNWGEKEVGKKKEMSDVEKWKWKYLEIGVYRSPSYYGLMEFSADTPKVSSGHFWKLIHNISLWNLGSTVVGIILAYSLLDSLFVQAKKNGEDAIVLNFVSPAKRSELFTAKSLTYITALGLFTLLGFIIPYGIIMLNLGVGIPAAFPLLVLWATIIGSILFFLFPASLYLFTSNLGLFGKILYYFLTYFSLIWMIINLGSFNEMRKGGGSFSGAIAKLEYWYYNPLFHIPLAIILGGLLLFLYYSHYREEDLA